jgi:hypothetical protein
MKIAIVQSTQDDSCGSVVPNEKAAMTDFCNQLTPHLIEAGHNAQHFSGNDNLGVQAATSAAAWNPDVVLCFHLDSAGGAGAAMFCYQFPARVPIGMAILGSYCVLMNYKNKGGQLRIQGVNGGRVAQIRIPDEVYGIPTVLFECGDMDGPDGNNWIKAEYRAMAAMHMAEAICHWAGGIIPVKKPKEETVLYQGVGTNWKFPDLWMDKYNYFLHIWAVPNSQINLFLQPHDKTEIPCNPFRVDADGHWGQDILAIAKGYNVTTSFGLRILSTDGNSLYALREYPK